MDLRTTAATCLLFFLMGYLTAPEYQEDEEGSFLPTRDPIYISKGQPDDVSLQSVLQRQGTSCASFQTKIEATQNPEACRITGHYRRLTVKKSSISAVGANEYEEFARAFHFLSLSLQVAVATGRVLSLEEDWALLPEVKGDCTAWNVDLESHRPMIISSIACLMKATKSKCPASSKIINSAINQAPNLDSSLAFGIIADLPITKDNSLFHAGYYGTETVMEMPPWPYPKDTYLIDVVPTWERSFGRFWVRSQVVHYLWQTWQVPAKSPVNSWREPCIAFYWSSCKNLRKNLAAKFGRNATVTQDFGHYMKFATTIRKEVDPKVETIYIVTDGVTNGVPIPNLQDLAQQYPDWKFVAIPSTKGETTSGAAQGEKLMLAVLEVMRKADYLVGSFQSQMFRLAAELNAAWLCSHYPVSMKRHWTVDVEWFENP